MKNGSAQDDAKEQKQQRPGKFPDLRVFETLKPLLPTLSVERAYRVVLGHNLFCIVDQRFGLRQ